MFVWLWSTRSTATERCRDKCRYAVRAHLDAELSRQLARGRLFVGQKLRVCGARLTGSDEAAPPLEAYARTAYQIGANNCRAVPWDAKLGFTRDPSLIIPLRSVHPQVRARARVCSSLQYPHALVHV